MHLSIMPELKEAPHSLCNRILSQESMSEMSLFQAKIHWDVVEHVENTEASVSSFSSEWLLILIVKPSNALNW